MKNEELWQSPVKPVFVWAEQKCRILDYFINDVYDLMIDPSWWQFQWILSEYFHADRHVLLLDLYDSITNFYYSDDAMTNVNEGTWAWFQHRYSTEMYTAMRLYYNQHKKWWMPKLKDVKNV
jgi:hypothetical protein